MDSYEKTPSFADAKTKAKADGEYETVSLNMYMSRVNHVFLLVQRIKSISRNRWSLSPGLKDPGPCSSHQF